MIDKIEDKDTEVIMVPCTKENLRKFARAEILYSELIHLPEGKTEYWEYMPECEETYQMTYEDMYSAIRHFLGTERTAWEFFYDWFERWCWDIGDLIGIPKLLGYEDGITMGMICDLEEPYCYFPKNQAQLLKQLRDELVFWESEYDACILDDKDFPGILQDLLERMDNQEFNSTHGISEWRFTDRQKKDIVLEYEEERKLAKLGSEKQKLYKKFLEEFCEKGDLKAIRIKGYACYGDGNPIYPCDWETSRDCMLQLVEKGDDQVQAQAANTLGYIYYYGRCNGGIPEYDLAYKYFSLASFFGYYEATYKVGDMLAGGKGIPKNETAAWRLYNNVYLDCYKRFQEGDKRQTLADAALRMGGAYQNGKGVYPDLISAYKYYLQAKLAIDIRMKHSDFFGNKKVLAGIEKGLEDTRAALLEEGTDVSKTSVDVDIEDLIDVLMHGKHTVRMRADKQDGNHVFRFERIPYEYYEPAKKVMITVPEVSYCKRTDKLVFSCSENEPFTIKNDEKEIEFDEVKVVDNNLKLYKKGRRQAVIPSVMTFDKLSNKQP